MNTALQSAETLQPSAAQPPFSHESINPPIHQSTSPTPVPRPGRTRHRRTGKVAVLPKTTRHKINLGLDDGVPYQQLIDSLGPEGAGLTIHNLSEWKDGGYEDYLQDKLWRDDMLARQEAYFDLLAGSDPLKLPEAGLQVAVTDACELLRDLSDLRSSDGRIDPDQFVRVANSLSRLSRSVLTLQQHREDAARARTVELARKDPNRSLVDPERDLCLDRADDLFGFKSHLRLQRELAQAEAQPFTPVPHQPQPSEPENLPQPASLEANRSEPAQPPPAEHSDNSCSPTDSLIPDSPPPPIPHSTPAPTIPNPASSNQYPASNIQYPASSIEHPATSIQNQDPPRPTCNLEPATCNPPPAPVPSTCICRDCAASVPLPDSDPPPAYCRRCGGKLLPPGFFPPQPLPDRERCHACRALLPPLLPNGQRPSPYCPNCETALLPPNAPREFCSTCGALLPVDLHAPRPPATLCPICNTTLPP